MAWAYQGGMEGDHTRTIQAGLYCFSVFLTADREIVL
jgi:hypothetical protein